MTDEPEDRRPSGADTDGPFRGLRNWLKQLRGDRAGEQDLRSSIEELIEDHDADEQPIDPQVRDILANILKLHGLSAADVMVPRVDIVAIELEMPFDQVLKAFIEHGHSRMPVYRETLDDVVGMVHVKDVLPCAADGKSTPLAKVARKVLFAAPSIPILELLSQMRQTRIHLALVVDEFGGVDGLVTIEDVIEQIVGEIEDEHDPADLPQFIERPDGTVIAEARMPIDALEHRAGRKLLPPEVEEEVNTLGGLVTTLAGRVPTRGEVLKHPAGFDIEVLDADLRRVKRLRLRGLPPETEVEHA
jgi:CBS domain containing-hemolysin-like protein